MGKVFFLAVLVGGLSLLVAAESFPFLYAFYYDMRSGQDLTIKMLGTTPLRSDYWIKIYDQNRTLRWDTVGVVDGYGAEYWTLSSSMSNLQNSWGVITVETATTLVIGLEYFKDGRPIAVDVIYRPVPELTPGEPSYLGTYYTYDVWTESPELVVMNPWDVSTTATVTIYDQFGRFKREVWVDLGPHQSKIIDLTEGMVYGWWGLLDVEMSGHAVVVALRYFTSSGDLFSVKNIPDPYLR